MREGQWERLCAGRRSWASAKCGTTMLFGRDDSRTIHPGHATQSFQQCPQVLFCLLSSSVLYSTQLPSSHLPDSAAMALKTAEKKAAPKSSKVGRKPGNKGKKSVESWKIYIYKVNRGSDPAEWQTSRCGICSDWSQH